MANQRKGRHLITTSIEHPAVLEAMKYLESQDFEVTYLPVDQYGVVSADAVEEAMREDTILVSIMHTNNEIGSVQPIEEIGKRIKKKNPACLFHVDAVQGFGKARIYPQKWGIDLLAVSGHKIHAPKGIGFLYIGDKVKVRNLIFGGGQQNGMRSGTENVAGIAGMGLAAKMIYQDFDTEMDKLYGMREKLIELVSDIPEVFVNGPEGRLAAHHQPYSARRARGSAAACARGQGRVRVVGKRLRDQPAASVRHIAGHSPAPRIHGQYHPDQPLRHEYGGGHPAGVGCAA